jgi:hypothetical protein
MRSIFYLFFVNHKVFHNELRNIDKDGVNNGLDSRIIEMNTNNSIYRMNEIHYKKKLLDKLTSNSISIQDKIDIIDKHDIFEKKYIDLYSGGLMDDYEFKFPPHR